jgi:hypothetical protein
LGWNFPKLRQQQPNLLENEHCISGNYFWIFLGPFFTQLESNNHTEPFAMKPGT